MQSESRRRRRVDPVDASAELESMTSELVERCEEAPLVAGILADAGFERRETCLAAHVPGDRR